MELYNFVKTTDKKLFILIFIISLTIFVFTSDAHRYTIDEDFAQQQGKRIALQQPHPDYIQNESKLHFENEQFKNPTNMPICYNGILCATAKIGHSITEAPLIFINYHLNIITEENVVWTNEDFVTPHYVWWRNSLDPDFTFLELFYGPIFTALSSSIFFLVCRSFNFTQKTSITISFLFCFTTIAWAYSQTSLNSVPASFFILLGFYFIRKFHINGNSRNMILCSVSLGFSYLVRPDTILFIAVLFFYLIFLLWSNNNKIKNFLSFLIPLISSHFIAQIIDYIRFGSERIQNTLPSVPQTTSQIPVISGHTYPLYEGGFGLLLSPGAGLLIFSPIFFLIFLSFTDFFKRNKQECILCILFVATYIIFFGTTNTWHGLQSWGPRYLLPMIPFLMLPLGASIEKRKNKLFKISLIMLGSIGVFHNLSYLIQDVSWFIWGWPGISGLYGIDKMIDGVRHPLNIDPVILWTFEYSQLTHSIIGVMTNFQFDIFLLKILSPIGFALSLVSILSLPVYYLLKIVKTES